MQACLHSSKQWQFTCNVLSNVLHHPLSQNRFWSRSERFTTSAIVCRRKKDKDGRSSPIRSLPPKYSSPTGIGGGKDVKEPSNLFKPVLVKPNPDDLNFGEELAGKLDKSALMKQLNIFYSDKAVRLLCKEHGIDEYLLHQTYASFRRMCMDITHLPTDLHIKFSDILQGVVHVHDLFPYFLAHAKKVFPHLDCIDELKQISDLTGPPNWYPEARAMNRKIIFHSGPTNSGKTYHALERFMSSKSGIYCGPLKLLAVEVFNKCASRGVPCDLVTGEERRMVSDEPSEHIACTVEMSNLAQKYEVAVIDEIQVIKDYQRGWAWTRALLGIQADEIHVCGEAAAIDLVKEMMIYTGEEVEVRQYKRLTKLIIEDTALGNLSHTQPGDCIVCFNKNDIYNVSRKLEEMGKEVAVIYGSLPPNTKLAMANKFNDPEDPCKILVATDAVGMGLNLNIRRVIFYSINKIHLMENGDKEVDIISVSQALQIAGRAGRFGTQWETGYVTTFKDEELNPLKDLLSQTPDDILQAGLHPTFDQLEMYAYHLPAETLSNLINIFISLSTLDDSLYTLCHLDDFKYLADMIEHIKLPLKAKYVFCCAPINRKMPFVNSMFLKMVRQYSKGDLISFDWLCSQIGWPFSPPDTIEGLVHLESVHDVFDIYLWLSYRFPDVFCDVFIVREVQRELDLVIEQGVINIVALLTNKQTNYSSGLLQLDEDTFEAKTRKGSQLKDKWTHDDANMAGNAEKRDKNRTVKIFQEKLDTKEQQQQDRNLPEILGLLTVNPESQPVKKIRKREKSVLQTILSKDSKQDSSMMKRLVNDGVITSDLAAQLTREIQSQGSRHLIAKKYIVANKLVNEGIITASMAKKLKRESNGEQKLMRKLVVDGVISEDMAQKLTAEFKLTYEDDQNS